MSVRLFVRWCALLIVCSFGLCGWLLVVCRSFVAHWFRRRLIVVARGNSSGLLPLSYYPLVVGWLVAWVGGLLLVICVAVRCPLPVAHCSSFGRKFRCQRWTAGKQRPGAAANSCWFVQHQVTVPPRPATGTVFAREPVGVQVYRSFPPLRTHLARVLGRLRVSASSLCLHFVFSVRHYFV